VLVDCVLSVSTALFVHADLHSAAFEHEVERPGFLAACLLGLYGLVMLVSLVSLYSYHLNLIAINQTTNENIKGIYGHGSVNPFNKGCWANYMNLCCNEPLPPSALPTMHEFVNVLEYARLRDSFTVRHAAAIVLYIHLMFCAFALSDAPLTRAHFTFSLPGQPFAVDGL